MCAGVGSVCVGVGSGGRFRKVPEGSGKLVLEGFGRLRRVPVVFVAFQPGQKQPCDCFEHLLVMTLSTWTKPGAHAGKHGI